MAREKGGGCETLPDGRCPAPDRAVEGEYTARFTVGAGDALTYQGITALTGSHLPAQDRAETGR